MVVEIHVDSVQVDKPVVVEFVCVSPIVLGDNVEMMDVGEILADLVHQLKHAPMGFVLVQQPLTALEDNAEITEPEETVGVVRLVKDAVPDCVSAFGIVKNEIVVMRSRHLELILGCVLKDLAGFVQMGSHVVPMEDVQPKHLAQLL